MTSKGFRGIILRLVIGAPLMFLLLSLFTGGINDAASLLLISIVCTGGVGLLLWVPLSFAIGATILAIAKYLGVRSDQSNQVLSADEQALQTYISQMKDLSKSDEEIEINLRASGWAEPIIKNAIQKYSNSAGKS